MHLPVNTLLHGGTYRIIRFISSGGFGCTYEAEHVMLEKRVAIKEFFVKDFCNRDDTTAHITVGTVSKKSLVEKLRRKFIDEARALCRLQHPGIVSVSDVFEENGTAYFVMDYVDGRSLSEIVRETGPLSEVRAVRYIRQVAAALRYVHENNRLHLDIKPGNIMVDGCDNPILIDFGASKQYDEEAGENTSTLMGKTPGYAPPEQMSNSVVKFLPATDIYALGATLYKLLTGITPPDASLRISGEELDPLPTDIASSTCRAVEAAMEINKHKRPQSLTAFVALLEDATPPSGEHTVFDAERNDIQQDAKPLRRSSKTKQPKRSASFVEHHTGMLIAITIIAGFVIGWFLSRDRMVNSSRFPIIDTCINESEEACYGRCQDDSVAVEPAPIQKPAVSHAGSVKSQSNLSKTDNQRNIPIAKSDAPKRVVGTRKTDSKATSKVEETIEDDAPFVTAETMPKFQGGDLNTFRNWVQSNVKFPQIALENGIQGRVILSFVIERDGRLTDIKVLQTPDCSLSEEAIRVLNMSPKWTPGQQQRNQAVRVRYTLPVEFRVAN